MTHDETRTLLNRLLAMTLGMLLFAGVLALAVVGVRRELSVAAGSNQKLEQRLVEVERRLAETTARLAAAQSPEVLMEANARLRLGLAQPSEKQVVRVGEDTGVRLVLKQGAGLYSIDFPPPARPVALKSAPKR